MFCVQKHAASSLHYDFRLEIEGVLKSWSVPKGPSFDPSKKRLAVQTEDHPLDYGSFEGVIPQDEYGGGTVMLWDYGEFETDESDPAKALDSGKLSFRLHGDKLEGGFALVRMRHGGKDRNWLLIKTDDDWADPQYDVLQDRPESVDSGRSLEEIAEGENTSEPSRRSGRGSSRRTSGHSRKQDKPKQRHDDGGADRHEIICGVRLSSPSKILYRDQGLSKLALATYYRDISEWILPHIEHRPLTLVRCPDGSDDECFYQKHFKSAVPKQMGRVEIQEQKKQATYMVIRDAAGLIAAVQIGALELHVWGSREDKIERPDRMVFDLDPGQGVDFSDVVDAARELEQRLSAVGLESFPLLTGGKGVHVVVPLERRHDFDEVRAFAKAVAKRLVHSDPERYIAEASKSKRKNKIFVDYLRNSRGSTAICPYSTRASDAAPVATPVRWSELGRAAPDRYNLDSINSRLARLERDPWDGYFGLRQRIRAQAVDELDW